MRRSNNFLVCRQWFLCLFQSSFHHALRAGRISSRRWTRPADMSFSRRMLSIFSHLVHSSGRRLGCLCVCCATRYTVEGNDGVYHDSPSWSATLYDLPSSSGPVIKDDPEGCYYYTIGANPRLLPSQSAESNYILGFVNLIYVINAGIPIDG